MTGLRPAFAYLGWKSGSAISLLSVEIKNRVRIIVDQEYCLAVIDGPANFYNGWFVTSNFLTGLAVFLLNTLRLLEVSRSERVFFAVTFTDFAGLEEQGILIPNIFIYPKPASVGFLEKVRENDGSLESREMKEVKRYFSNCGVETAFDFYESRFHDAVCAEEIVRVFAVPRTC